MLNISSMIMSMIAGLGLFIYGMQLMAGALQKAAGDRMRRLLDVLTSNTFFAVIVGTVVTAIVQSSSATSVMVIGFVNAGLMTLRQAVGVILGANIGTTVTTQMVSFHLTQYAPIAIGIGVIMLMFGKKKSTKDIGEIFLGFGILFFGMSTMSVAMKPLRTFQPFINLMTSVAQQPLLGVLIGAGFTAVIQSSSATTAIVVALATQGLVDLPSAIPLILGSNIGTTITALLASINTTLASRRTAIAHTIIKFGGVILCLFVLKPFTALALATHTDTARQIANAHTIFNVANTLILMPFINQFVHFIESIVPDRDEGEGAVEDEAGAIYLDQMLLTNPSIALGQATLEIERMGNLAINMLDDTQKAFETNDEYLIKKALNAELLINQLNGEIISYLVGISQSSLTREQSMRLNYLFESVNDIERIGDHAENICEQAQYKMDHNLPFSDTAMEELTEMYGIIRVMIRDALVVLKKKNEPLMQKVKESEMLIDRLEAEHRHSHITRLSEGSCHPKSGIVYLDVLGNFERIADHANNVCIKNNQLRVIGVME